MLPVSRMALALAPTTISLTALLSGCAAVDGDQLDLDASAATDHEDQDSLDEFDPGLGATAAGTLPNESALPQEKCDDNLPVAGDASAAARAIELCTPTQGSATSLLSAALVRANGGASITSRQIGLVANFGPNVAPRAGERMLALSSGSARPAAAPDACGAVSCNGSGPGTAPPGFPQDVPGCSGAQQIHDDIGLEVELRAPSAAQAYAFDFTFYSHEYPEFVCSAYNDQFIALASPAPEGSIGGNISFDDKNNPVSINIAFFEVCQGCPQGTQALVGTGFDTWGEGLGDAGATGWLTTKAPILGGELVTLRFTIWDTGDTELDSTVLVDNFRWLASTVEVGTIPAPK